MLPRYDGANLDLRHARASHASGTPASFSSARSCRTLACGRRTKISGWNPNVPPPAPMQVSSEAIAAVPADDANVYKGVAIAGTLKGDFLYASNFRTGTPLLCRGIRGFLARLATIARAR